MFQLIGNYFIKFSNNKGQIYIRPVPAPDSTKELDNNKINDGTSNHNEILLSLGKAISTQLPFDFHQKLDYFFIHFFLELNV